ncbi:MAG: hypothetical protein ACKVE4_12325 [Dissulfuribacterales bacterium]
MASWIKTPFYRIFVNLPVGIIAFVIFHNRFPCLARGWLPEHGLFCQSPFCKWCFVVPVLLVVGEIYSFAGEMIVNFLFEYIPFRAPGKEKDSVRMECVFPCSRDFLRYETFVLDPGQGAGFAFDISELHFALSRLFAGIMAVATGIVYFCLPFIAACVVFLVSCFIACCENWDSQSEKKGFCCLFTKPCCRLFVRVLVFGIYIVCSTVYGYKGFNFKLLLIAAVFFAIVSIHYRVHANQVLYEMSREKYKRVDFSQRC